MKAVVLCAGLGTRMGALTRNLPKAMLPIGGEPLLAHTLRHLARHGFGDVAVNLFHYGESIEKHFGDGSSFGVHIHYSHEDRLLGTAGTVRSLEPWLADEDDALVIYGDLFFDEDLSAMLGRHRTTNAGATLLVHQRVGSNSLIAMDEEHRIQAFLERPSEEERRAHPYPWVNSGIAFLRRDVRARIPERTPVDLPKDVYVPLVEAERLYGYPITGYRCAIDSPDRLASSEEAFRSGKYRR